MSSHALFPVFLKLEGRLCVVVGGGSVAEGRIASLLVCGADVTVIAPSVAGGVAQWAEQSRIAWKQREFRDADVVGAHLVIAATSNLAVNARVYAESLRRGALCNVVDDPAHCDFYTPALVRQGALQIAISTGGKSPALAQRLRRELEKQFGAEYEQWLELLGAAREELFAQAIDPEERRQLLHAMASDQAFRAFLREFRLRPVAAGDAA